MSEYKGFCIVAIPRKPDFPTRVEDGVHVTLAFLGDTDPGPDLFQEAKQVAKSVSRMFDRPELVASIGFDFFGPNKEHAVLLLDSDPETSFVTHLRELVIRELTVGLAERFIRAETWPQYTPHMTLGRIDEGYILDESLAPPEAIEIHAIAVWSGEDRWTFPLNAAPEDESDLKHYGILRRSGRYPWGSGGNAYQRSGDFRAFVEELKKGGLTESEIARACGLNSTTELRATNTIAKNAIRRAEESEAQRLKAKGMSTSAVARQMGKNESSVRALLDPQRQANADILLATSATLKKHVDEKEYLDIGVGTEATMGISKTKLDTAISVLQEQGYQVHQVYVEQVGNPGKYTEAKVLTKPGVTKKEILQNQEKIQPIDSHSNDGGRTFQDILPPKSVSSKRVEVVYGPDGGSKMDGVIELRPGVDDISLAGKRYAQVRIAVDDSHYIKGMAVYADDLPPGVDIRFNTNKESTGNKLDALKPLDGDPDRPFGAIVAQRFYKDASGKEHLSAINRVGSKDGQGEEGGWATWSKNISSQVLSKQAPDLARKQLDLAYQSKKDEFDEIMALTNPAVKKKLLESFSDSADSASVTLKAQALPGQRTHVLLANKTLKDNEVYAPGYENGSKVVLIRHPHGGTFEIPELTVNNRNPSAKKLLGNVMDAVAINSNVAQRLSGADFDGDTVLVIPNDKKHIKTSAPLKGLKDFDPITAYPGYEGMKRLEGKAKQKEMGIVSNLITDMTIKGATESEIARAVRHSMVVIDAEKHKLNYKQSEIDNGIKQLKQKWQSKEDSRGLGASTLISRAKSEVRIEKRRPTKYSEGGPIDLQTGEKRWTPTGESYVNKQGKTVFKTTKVDALSLAKDANKLSSGTAMERIYADHSNKLKSLANQARLESTRVQTTPYSPTAAKAYSKEVASLNSKLGAALKNKPLERQAQFIANAEISAKKRANPDMDSSELKKVKNQALSKARARTQAQKQRVDITPSEWAAIQAGAISNNKLTRILQNTDDAVVKKYATPRQAYVMSDAKIARAKAMLARGYTQQEIASQLGVPTSTLNDSLSR